MRVRWQRRALSDLRAIRDYLRERSPAGAARVVGRIRELTTNLTQFPLAHPAIGDLLLRRLVVTRTPYVVYYRIRDDEILIEAVFHRAQNRPI